MNKAIRLMGALCIPAILAACGSDKSISERVALSEVAHYLESNPVYETAQFDYGEVKFRQKSDADQLEVYRTLEQGGYVSMELLKERKRFLSKDSTFTYLVTLTDSSIPFVLDKTDRQATVKTAVYTLNEDGSAHLEQPGKNRVKATVTLHKAETPFSRFAKKAGDHASFIKKTYTLRFDGDAGWQVTK